MSFNSLEIWMNRTLMPIDDPGSRLFHWNLIAAFSLILCYAVFQFGWGGGVKSLKKLIFRKKYWWNRSTQKDYYFYFTNSIFKVFLFIPFLDFSFHIARSTSHLLLALNGDEFLGVPASFTAVALFTTLSFVWDDFLRYFHHLLMHRVPFLWRLHSVHHSAKILTPITLYRAHPLESAIATVRNSLSLGVSAGVFIFVFESQLNVWTIAGVNAFGFMFNFLGANLRHSHIPLRFGSLMEKILISPVQHQVHHSSRKEHYDKNFGVSLALWDYLAGTLVESENLPKLKFGLGHVQNRTMAAEYGLDGFFKSCRKASRSLASLRPTPVAAPPTLRTEAVPHKDF